MLIDERRQELIRLLGKAMSMRHELSTKLRTIQIQIDDLYSELCELESAEEP